VKAAAVPKTVAGVTTRASVDGTEAKRPDAPDAGQQGAPKATGVGAGVQALAFAQLGPDPARAARDEVIAKALETGSAALDQALPALNGLAEIGVGQAPFDEQRMQALLEMFATHMNAARSELLPLEQSKDLNEAQTEAFEDQRGRFMSYRMERRRMMI